MGTICKRSASKVPGSKNEKKELFALSQFKSSDPQKGLCMVPKRALDVPQCEIARFLKVTPKDIVIPVSFKVPRKSELFQDDIFPDSFSGQPSSDVEKFKAGENAEPDLVSMQPNEDGVVLAKASEAPAVAFVKQEAAKELTADEIKEEWEAQKKRIAYLESELAKRDAKIKDLEAK